MQDDEEIVYHEKHYNGGATAMAVASFFKA